MEHMVSIHKQGIQDISLSTLVPTYIPEASLLQISKHHYSQKTVVL